MHFRDADKGDEPRTKTKIGPKGRNKRPLEDAGEPSDDDNEETCQGSKYSKEVAKKAKVNFALLLTLTYVLVSFMAVAIAMHIEETCQGFKSQKAAAKKAKVGHYFLSAVISAMVCCCHGH